MFENAAHVSLVTVLEALIVLRMHRIIKVLVINVILILMTLIYIFVEINDQK